MSLPRTVGDVMREHVTLEVECIDRMYLNVYVPILQAPAGVAHFWRKHRGYSFASSALMQPMSKGFVRSIDKYVRTHGIPLVQFGRKERKDDVTQKHLARFTEDEGVLYVGKAQERAKVTRTQKRFDGQGRAYPWLVPSTSMVNHYYFYCVDTDFGPFFLKFCSYFPYNAKLCINGHEYVKRQLAKEGIAFEALDNGVRSCADPARLQALCDDLDEEKIDGLLRKWLAILPQPFSSEDRAAGYRYDVSILQAEFALTQVHDRPVTGRILFEQIIRENLDLGRPDNVQLIFQRRVTKRTPSRFRTRVITKGVIPSLHVDYKHTRIKQYHKENSALRTETTINDTYDFAIGRRLKNLPALREVGFQANRRLLGVQRISQDCTLGEDAFRKVGQPVVVDGQRAASLRFGDPRVLALLSALVLFRLLPRGFSNRDLRECVAPLLGTDPSQFSQGKMTYDLRRLRLHGLIGRIPRTHRYEVTDFGFRAALFFTRSYARLLRPGLASLAANDDATPSRLRAAFTRVDTAIDELWRSNVRAA